MSGPSLGVGLALLDGDLVLALGARDLALVRQEEMLVQALTGAVATQLGSDRLNAQFGFDRLAIGAYAEGLEARRAYVKLQLVRALTADRRVREVTRVVFEDEPAFAAMAGLDPAIAAAIAAAARRSREYTVHAAVDTVAGDAVALTLADTGV